MLDTRKLHDLVLKVVASYRVPGRTKENHENVGKDERSQGPVFEPETSRA
jgi:hypothetical protein